MSKFSSSDYNYMSQAIQLAKRGRYTAHPNPCVGCVMVKNGEIISTGWHEKAGEPHAEVHALRKAGELAAGSDVYVTLEPCAHFGRTPPCADALIQAKVNRVVVAMTDPNPQVAGQGLQRLQQAGIETASGLLETESRALNPGFIRAMQDQRPWVRIKMAMSLDGRTAMASGESTWITGAAARRDVQFWRARAGAILTGIDTVLIDKPSLNVRLTAKELGVQAVRQPDRVILDSGLRLPADTPMLQLPGQVRVYTCNHNAGSRKKMSQLQKQGVLLRQFTGKQPELAAVLNALYQDGINEVHVEAGATLTGRLIEQELADELVVYMAPCLMGSSARPLFNFSLTHMQARLGLEITEVRAIGKDWRILAKPACQLS